MAMQSMVMQKKKQQKKMKNLQKHLAREAEAAIALLQQDISSRLASFLYQKFPIRVIDLQEMRLISRSDVGQQVIKHLEEEKKFATVIFDKVTGPASDPEALFSEACRLAKYAILSHRWYESDKELQFQHFPPKSQTIPVNDLNPEESMNHVDNDPAWTTTNFHLVPKNGDDTAWTTNQFRLARTKLVNFCKVASEYYHCRYAWVDTCCIDRSSHVELDESIRSMFTWYSHSEVCIVHLRSTSGPIDLAWDPWFSRGWTLQELLAPQKVKFFDLSWTPLIPLDRRDKPDDHSKSDLHGKTRLSVAVLRVMECITKIPRAILNKDNEFTSLPARSKLQWMSHRETTRMEDSAYCLFGMLDVNMPIAYGEQEKAFFRLQQEMIRFKDDKGIFLWSGVPSPHNSMFAKGPENFVLDVGEISSIPVDNVDTEMALTSRGLRIHLPLFEVEQTNMDNVYILKYVEYVDKVYKHTRPYPGRFKVSMVDNPSRDPLTKPMRCLGLLLCARETRIYAVALDRIDRTEGVYKRVGLYRVEAQGSQPEQPFKTTKIYIK